MNFPITETGIYTVNPTGINVYNNTLTTPLNIPSGYVANCVIKLLPVSAIKSDLLIQKLKLPSIIAIDVNIKLPVIANNTNNKNTLT